MTIVKEIAYLSIQILLKRRFNKNLSSQLSIEFKYLENQKTKYKR